MPLKRQGFILVFSAINSAKLKFCAILFKITHFINQRFFAQSYTKIRLMRPPLAKNSSTFGQKQPFCFGQTERLTSVNVIDVVYLSWCRFL